MKSKVKGLVIGLILGTLVGGAGTIYAAGGNLIEVFYTVKDMRIDKVSKMPEEQHQKPFTYNGTTFVPLRFVAESLGQDVQWDSKTQTIAIGEAEQANEVYVGNKWGHMSYQQSKSPGGFISYYHGKKIESSENIETTQEDNVGNKYDNFLVMYTYDWAHVEYPLNGQYKTFQATYALTSYMKQRASTGEVQIYLDEQLAKTIVVKPGLLPENIELDVTNANKIGFKVVNDKSVQSENEAISIGLYNARVTK